MQWVFDIEANGFNPDKIWCVVVSNGDEEHSFTDANAFQHWLDSHGGDLFAHNGHGYDYYWLREIWGIQFRGWRLYDTLALSRLANPERLGGHSLENWGGILGFPKGEFSDFSVYSGEMLDYCKRDVQVTLRLLEEVQKELVEFSQRSIDLENETLRIIEGQRRNGWFMDRERATALLAELHTALWEAEHEVRRVMKPMAVPVKVVEPKYKNDGGLSKVGLACLGEDALKICGGPFTRIEWQEFNLGSRQQIGVRLQRAGWKPETFTETGQPKCDEEILELVAKFIPEAALINEYLTMQKRIGMVNSWLEFVGEDGRLRGYVNSCGAVTNRMTHSEPNMAQVTSSRKKYGKEMRQCWRARKGYKVVGIDADQLELRMLAHYMNDPEYIFTVDQGDAHTANQVAAGLPTRDDAKTFIYAFVYGAGNEKIGLIIGKGKKEGALIKKRFIQSMPALKRLTDRVKKAARARGRIKTLDGRYVACDEDYKALNRLLQSAGAILMKEFLVVLEEYLDKHKIDYKFVGNIHDEVQAEVREDQAETYAWIAEACMVKAGQNLGLRIPTTGKASIGDSWAETH